MSVAVIGGTGLVGAEVMTALRALGHDAVSLSRSSGVDVLTGAGLDDALRDVDTVIDVGNSSESEPTAMIDYFARSAAVIAAAERRSGVTHHVLLSIIGVDRVEHYPHFRGKSAQEAAVRSSGVPYTILRATQFFEFAETAVLWGAKDGYSDVPPLLMQPLSTQDAASELVALASAEPRNETVEVGGPERHDLVDLARRTQLARGGPAVRLVPSWQQSGFGEEMAGDLLLPHEGATITTTTAEEWLASIAAR